MMEWWKSAGSRGQGEGCMLLEMVGKLRVHLDVWKSRSHDDLNLWS
jgi:hypothetical protein